MLGADWYSIFGIVLPVIVCGIVCIHIIRDNRKTIRELRQFVELGRLIRQTENLRPEQHGKVILNVRIVELRWSIGIGEGISSEGIQKENLHWFWEIRGEVPKRGGYSLDSILVSKVR